MKRRDCLIIVCILLTAMAVVHAASLSAKSIHPGQVKISTPVYAPKLSQFNPRLGQYTYLVSWQGIPAGTIELNLKRAGADYEINARARTAEAIDYIYKLRYESKVFVSAETLMPKQTVSTSRVNSRDTKTTVEFLPDGEIYSVHKDHRGKTKSIRFNPDNFTLEPYSAAFLALSQDWAVGDRRLFDTFNGRNRYLIELTAVDRAEIIINGRIRKAIVISPKVTKLTDTDTKKLRDAKIYISDDNSREILKISSELFFGSLDTDMVSSSLSAP